MPGETMSAEIPPELHEMARQTASAEGSSLDEIVSTALSLYLILPRGAHHTARMVQEAGNPEARATLRRETTRAIAAAGIQALRARLVAHGKELGIQDPTLSEEDLVRDAVEAVKEERRERRTAVGAVDAPSRPQTATAKGNRVSTG